MRTKTILLSGVVTALSSASMMAQVYSLNAVGYINVTVPTSFSIIANQLNTTNNNISPLLDSQLLDGAHNGVTIFKYNGSYTVLVVSQSGTNQPQWSAPATAQATTLNPGEAAFIYNPYSTNLTLTFVGTVLQGSLTNALPTGFSLASSIVPQSGAIDSVLGLVANPGDAVFLYNGAYSVSVASSTSSGIVFSPSAPVPAVGQGFFYYTANPSGETWVRTFNVN